MFPCLHRSKPPRIHKRLFILLIAMGLMPFAPCSLLFAQSPEPYVVMLSMDGFRWDYPERCGAPNLDKIAAGGVKAESLRPSFPSKTFANHYTMATGLYPDHHGIVENSFYDPPTGKHYSIGNRAAVEDASFYAGEPIWVTAEKQGVKSASFYWVGSEAPIMGIQPAYWKRYEEGVSFTSRIDTVIYWLSLPEERRPHLVMWYMDEPDATGHDEGPLSEATCRMVNYLDSLVGVFMEKINALPNADDINIIITSDHGMGPVSHDNCLMLRNYIDFDWFEEIEGSSPNLTLKVKEANRDTAWKVLSTIPHIIAWKHGEMPDSLHYGTNLRTLDFILVADSAWQFSLTDKVKRSGGAHGFNPYNTDMHAIFYATGPAFKTGYIQPVFENTDLYPLICRILHLEPAPADGKIENTEGMLRD